MKVCFPVPRNDGPESAVFKHFGSAPLFLLVNTKTGNIDEQINRDLSHAHGRCQPLKALDGKQVDVIVVGGIGKGALTGLNQSGLKVFRAQTGTVAENLAVLKENKLAELTPDMVCSGHAGHQNHNHGHGRGSHREFGCVF